MTIDSRAAPQRYGIGLCQCAGTHPDQAHVRLAAQTLQRDPYITDGDGYFCDILAAAVHPDGRLAYVEQRAKRESRHVDITIKIHLTGVNGEHRSADIRSYNPYSGCHVRFFQWHADTVVLIYREKHRTYAAGFGMNWPPQYHEIADRWIISDSTLAYTSNGGEVSRFSIPDFSRLETLAADVAQELDLYPPELDGFLDWPENEV